MKVSLVYGDIGSGHASAARALKEALEVVCDQGLEVEVVDLYEVADPAPWGDSDASSTAFSQTPLLRWINYLFNVVTDVGVGHYLLRRVILRQTLEPYRRFFQQSKPDLIVSLHPYTTITMSKLREQDLAVPYAVVVTDLASVLRGWADPKADLTISPTAAVTKALASLGVSRTRIVEPLFPLRPSLQQVIPKEQLFARHGLSLQRTTLVITGGGVGAQALAGVVSSLAQQDFQLIVICGRDKASAAQWRRDYKTNSSVVILEYVQDMQNYLAHADVVITKAGATSVLELELFETRAIITHELSSQEQGNAAYALHNPRFRFLDGDMKKLLPSLESLLTLSNHHLPPSRRRFTESYDIARHLLELIT